MTAKVLGMLLVALPLAATSSAGERVQDLVRRFESADARETVSLCRKLRKAPAESFPPLLDALEAWEDAGLLPDEEGLRAVDRAYACTPAERARKALEEVAGFPSQAAEPSLSAPDSVDSIRTWSDWWPRHRGDPPQSWRRDAEASARSCLSRPAAETRSRGCLGLAALRTQDASRLLSQAFRDAKEDLSLAWAFQALAVLGDAALAAEVPAGLSHASSVVREAAARAAGSLGDPALIPGLLPLAEEGLPGVRDAALASLILLGHAETAAGLEADLASEVPATRVAALKALCKLPRDRFAEILAGRAASVSGEAALELAAARLLLGDGSQLQVLAEALGHADRARRIAAARLLLQAGGKAGHRKVAEGFARVVGDAIGGGMEALGALKGRDYGYRALRTYALLACGESKRDLAGDLEEAAQGPPAEAHHQVYGLSVALMALAEAGGHPGMEALAKRLMEAQDGNGAWGYSRGASWDHSNSQFALLGLRAAADRGVEVPERVWRLAKEHWTGALAREDAYAGGWGYRSGGPASTGSMTCAGVCSLLICHRYLNPPPPGDGRKGHDHSRVPGVGAGLGWLDGRFRTARNPQGSDTWFYYYLYSIERTGVLAGVQDFGGRDWYREGALQILRRLEPGGGWGRSGEGADLADTCFALLFLRRATRRLYEVGGVPGSP